MVYKLNFPPAFMIKHNTVPKFLLQPSFGVLMNDSFNINISLNFCINITHLKKCLKLSIFNKSFQFSIRTCCTCLFMEAFIAWNYFFLINIIMFSCYDSLADLSEYNPLAFISSTVRPVSCAWIYSSKHPSENEIGDDDPVLVEYLSGSS